jgi:hypothetical protein
VETTPGVAITITTIAAEVGGAVVVVVAAAGGTPTAAAITGADAGVPVDGTTTTATAVVVAAVDVGDTSITDPRNSNPARITPRKVPVTIPTVVTHTWSNFTVPSTQRRPKRIRSKLTTTTVTAIVVTTTLRRRP